MQRNSAPQAPPRPARAITPEMLPALYDAGEQSVLLNRLDEAAWCFERALTLDPNSARARRGMAHIHHLAGRGEQARTAILDAKAHGLDAAEALTMLGQYCQADGDFPAAIAAFEQAIAITPTHGPAHLRLALLRTKGAPAADIAELERLNAAPDLTTDQRATLAFALAREYETNGDTDTAFARYQTANAIRHAQYPGYADSFASADPMMALFTPAFLRARKGFGSDSEQPVFVVGMMRSGTSLVEQILACHPQVHGHGELSDIRQIARATAADGRAYPACLAALDAPAIARLAERYLARLTKVAPTATRHIDKLPHNFENLGLISLMFPRARILHCTRDPIDVCVSNYFQDFGALNPFTYDLATLGRTHREYDRLMEHWRAVLPNPMLHVPYEALVADQEGWSRRMVDFLGLPWNEACLRFHESDRPVYTKSLWQVRQPIFRSAIGRSKPYRRHLGPLLAALGLPP